MSRVSRSRGRGAPDRTGVAESLRMVVPGALPMPNPLVTLRLHVADRALVQEGAHVEPGQPIIERSRETTAADVADGPATASASLGDAIDPGQIAAAAGRRNPLRPGDRPHLLFRGSDGRARLAVGRRQVVVTAPVAGVVEHLGAGTLSIRAEGVGLRAPSGWGLPVQGPLVLGVASPDAELRASALDVGAAGCIVVAGARADIESLTRARAIGVAGILSGGIVGRELRQLEEADRRQRAALHAAAAFAVVSLDGFGRRPIPGPSWDLLRAAEGRTVGLVPEAGWVVIGGEIAGLLEASARPPGSVRITAGDGLGREGLLAGLAGPLRRAGGLYQSAGIVEGVAAGDGEPSRRAVPLADLERFG